MTELSCPFCQSLNVFSAEQCAKCKRLLKPTTRQIENLILELKRLRQDTKSRLDELEMRILTAEKQVVFFERQRVFLKEVKEEPLISEQQISDIEQPVATEGPQEEVYEKEHTLVYAKPVYEQGQEMLPHQSDFYDRAKQQRKNQKQKKAPKAEPKPSEPFDWRKYVPDVVIELLIAPFAHLFALWFSAYGHYKKENKLPVFFMTLGGIAAFLMGFGYLMRYTSDTVWEASKIAISAVSAAGVLFLGHRLQSRDEKFKDYGSALIAFGVSLNFLWIYFLNDSPIVPLFFKETFAFLILVALNNALSAYLAIKFNSRVVLILSLVLGAFSPFFAQTTQISVLYFVYLWFLSAASLEIGRRMSWEVSVKITFWLVLAVHQFIFFRYSNSLNMWVFCGILHAFAYLFMYYVLHQNHRVKDTLQKEDIFVLAASMSLLAADIYALFDLQTRTGGYVFLGNTMFFALIFVFRRGVLSPKMQSVFMLLAGAMLAFAVPSLLERDLSALCWGLEAVALLYMGYVFGLPLVRYQGLLVLALAILKTLWLAPLIYQNWGMVLWNDGFLNLLGIGLIGALFAVVFELRKTERTDFEQRVNLFFQEILLLWFAFCAFTVLHFYLRDWAYPCMSLVGVLCLYASRRRGLVFAEVYSFGIILTPLAGLFFLFVSIQDLAFRVLPWYGRVDLLLVVFFFSTVPTYYEKVEPDYKKSLVYIFSTLLRELVFIALPLFFLPTVWRFYPLYFPLAACVSLAVVFVMYEFLKRFWLPYAAILALLGAAYVQINLPLEQQNMALMSAGLSLIFLLAYAVYKKIYTADAYKLFPFALVYYLSFFYTALLVFLVMVRLVTPQDFMTASSAALLFLMLLVVFKDKIYAFQPLAHPTYRLVQFWAIFTILHAVFAIPTSTFGVGLGIYVLVLGLLLYVVYADEAAYPAPKRVFWIADVYFVHLLIMGFYRAILIQHGGLWLETIFTVLCFVHGVGLLFSASIDRYKRLMTLAVIFFIFAVCKLWFVDMSNADMVRKIIVLMAVGLVLLLSAFFYVKIRDKLDKRA